MKRATMVTSLLVTTWLGVARAQSRACPDANGSSAKPLPTYAPGEMDEAEHSQRWAGRVFAGGGPAVIGIIGLAGDAFVGVHVSRALALELDGYLGGGLAPSGDDGFEARAFALSARYFLGDTFNVRVGVRKRDVWQDIHDHPGATAHVWDVDIEASVGSRWDFRWFFAGADWLTMGTAIASGSPARVETVWPAFMGPRMTIGLAW